MHVTHGIQAKNIQLALVVHGKAGFDLLKDKVYQKYQQALAVDVKGNPNTPLIDELIKNNVKIYLCGQSAAYVGIKNEDLHSGVKMSLSAMTAHALLQQEGYTLNPF
jgi:intracellular sulfur oxidation DsrE/DsrF family protein